ncbi:DUF6023 family protein [Pseudarthrobacter sp. O4]|uniref:DUF6023 family protein n=1 Tax=Pseudarthrobacter sp. O4 TaxID=3418417 RepID=UPI003CEB30A9
MPRSRTTASAVVVSLALLGGVLSGCAYEYDDGLSNDDAALPSAPAFTDAALPQDPGLNQPVSGAELDAWVRQVLPDAEGQVFHSGYGTLETDEERKETTTQLPKGTYALTLACRSTRRVSFSIDNGENELVDLSLRCGTSRVNVVYLAADAVLDVKVDANAPANFAYRVSRI